MGSSSLEFIGFAFIVVIMYQLFCSVLWRKLVLLTASYVFLSSFAHDVRAYLPLAGFLAFGYLGVRMVKRAPGHVFPLVVTATLLVFVWLKKYTFLPGAAFLSFFYLSLGLSYILFRILHLTIDTHNGLLTEDIGPLEYLIYMINFMTLLSGPIQKYPEFKAMVETPVSTRPGLLTIGTAAERIVQGFFKTNVLALILSDVQIAAVSRLSRDPHGPGHLMTGVVAFAAYPLFLYCNFSGYIDIVVGIALLLGITLPENFDRPFSSDSFIGFWSRWHITLSEWLRSYVYNPLLMALMRKYPSASLEPVWAVLASFVTFFLVGVWHGQTAAFLFFGLLQGLGVSMNKLYQILMTKSVGRKRFLSMASDIRYRTVARGLTFTWFTFTLLWFWSNWGQIDELFSLLGGRDAAEIWLAVLIGSSLTLTAWEGLRNAFLSIQWQGGPFFYCRYWRTAWNTALTVIILVVTLISNQPPPEIVYKAF